MASQTSRIRGRFGGCVRRVGEEGSATAAAAAAAAAAVKVGKRLVDCILSPMSLHTASSLFGSYDI